MRVKRKQHRGSSSVSVASFLRIAMFRYKCQHTTKKKIVSGTLCDLLHAVSGIVSQYTGSGSVSSCVSVVKSLSRYKCEHGQLSFRTEGRTSSMLCVVRRTTRSFFRFSMRFHTRLRDTGSSPVVCAPVTRTITKKKKSTQSMNAKIITINCKSY